MRLDLHIPQQAAAWVQAAAYLRGRVQSTPQQMPGRRPDLSPSAAAAMVGVMDELAESAAAWQRLQTLLGMPATAEPDGAASAQHLPPACFEGAQRLILNHADVRADAVNPYSDVNIQGGKLTQARTMTRVPYQVGRARAAQCSPLWYFALRPSLPLFALF